MESQTTECPECNGRGTPECCNCFGCGLDLSQHPVLAPAIDRVRSLRAERDALSSRVAELTEQKTALFVEIAVALGAKTLERIVESDDHVCGELACILCDLYCTALNNAAKTREKP